jgi:transcriptional regulator with XRE-family HTH domain
MDNLLGDFLRARRELVTPQEAELPVSSRSVRRVPGLRREEVAMLAGISAEYYVRLERGRDRTPSPSVVTALASALQLDAESTDYMLGLAGRRSTSTAARPVDDVPPGLLRFLHGLSDPAAVINRYTDVLAANPLAQALSPGFAPGVNRLRWEFTDPEARRSSPNWDRSASAAIAHLRAQAASDPADPRLHSLVGELSVRSEEFLRLWARHDVHVASGGEVELIHPTVGPMRLRAEKFIHTGRTGLELLVLQPADDATAITALRALARGLRAHADPSAAAQVRNHDDRDQYLDGSTGGIPTQRR